MCGEHAFHGPRCDLMAFCMRENEVNVCLAVRGERPRSGDVRVAVVIEIIVERTHPLPLRGHCSSFAPTAHASFMNIRSSGFVLCPAICQGKMKESFA